MTTVEFLSCLQSLDISVGYIFSDGVGDGEPSGPLAFRSSGLPAFSDCRWWSLESCPTTWRHRLSCS